MKTDSKNIIRIGLRLALILILFIAYVPIFESVVGDFHNPDRLEIDENAQLRSVFNFVFALLFLHALVRQAVIYNPDRRKEYLSVLAEEGNVSLCDKLCFILKNPIMWAQNAVFVLVYSLISSSVTTQHFTFWFMGGLHHAFKLLVIFVLLFMLELFAHLSAFKFWKSDKHSPEENPDKAFLLGAVFAVAVYFAGGAVMTAFVMPYLIPVFGSLWDIITYGKIPVYAAIIIVGYLLIHNLILYFTRRSFVKRLNRFCKEQKFHISPIKKPYASLFKMTDGENFTVKRGEKTYSCKIITCRSKMKSLYIMPDGNLKISTELVMFGATLLRYDKTRLYGYESDNTKILILNPAPKRVFTAYEGKRSVVENGFYIGGYFVYSGTGFINALERDTIVKKSENIYDFAARFKD